MEGDVAKNKSPTRGVRRAARSAQPKRKSKRPPAAAIAKKPSTRASAIARALPRPSAQARFAGVVNERARLETSIAAERADRMAGYATALQAFKKVPRIEAAKVLRVLAEGDSWFDYPVPFKTDTIRALQSRISTPIANMAHYGEEVRQMLGLKLREEIATRLAKGAPDGHPWDAMLFSGGGNDFVGDPLCLWLRPYVRGMGAADVVDSERFGAVLEIVRLGYADLIALRDQLSPATVLFFHQYDFAIPDGRGVCNIGPWLKPGLGYRRVPDAMRAEVVRIMLLQFAALVAAIAAPAGASVVVVPTQGTFPEQSEKWWANELHPTDLGFTAIADKFHGALKARFPGIP